MKSKEDIQKELIDMIATNPNEKYITVFEIYCYQNGICEVNPDPIVCQAFDEIAEHEWMVEAVRSAGLFKNGYKD